MDGEIRVLDADERRRYEALRLETDRRRYLLSHLALRKILGGDVQFERDARGKPRLRGRDLHFNLSHSGDLALVALCRDCEVGVDVEQARRDRTAEFLRGWVRREAYLKALGTGLTDSLLSVDPEGIPGWSILDVEVPSGYAAAAAAPRPHLTARICEWRW